MHDGDNVTEWEPGRVYTDAAEEDRAKDLWLEARPLAVSAPWLVNAAPQRPVDAPWPRQAPTTQASAPAVVQPSPAPAPAPAPVVLPLPVPDEGEENDPATPWRRLCPGCTAFPARPICSRCRPLLSAPRGHFLGPCVTIPVAPHARQCAMCFAAPLRAVDVQLCNAHRDAVMARRAIPLEYDQPQTPARVIGPGRFPAYRGFIF